jgi:hypothetical protein
MKSFLELFVNLVFAALISRRTVRAIREQGTLFYPIAVRGSKRFRFAAIFSMA